MHGAPGNRNPTPSALPPPPPPPPPTLHPSAVPELQQSLHLQGVLGSPWPSLLMGPVDHPLPNPEPTQQGSSSGTRSSFHLPVGSAPRRTHLRDSSGPAPAQFTRCNSAGCPENSRLHKAAGPDTHNLRGSVQNKNARHLVMLTPVAPWSSVLRFCQNLLEDLLQHRLLGPTPESLMEVWAKREN